MAVIVPQTKEVVYIFCLKKNLNPEVLNLISTTEHAKLCSTEGTGFEFYFIVQSKLKMKSSSIPAQRQQ